MLVCCNISGSCSVRAASGPAHWLRELTGYGPWRCHWEWLPGIQAWLAALFLCLCPCSTTTFEIWRWNSTITSLNTRHNIIYEQTPIKKTKPNRMRLKTLFIPGLNFSIDVTTFSQKKTTKSAIHQWNHPQPSVLSSKVNSNSTSFQLHYSWLFIFFKMKASHRKQVRIPFFSSCPPSKQSAKEFLPAENTQKV